MKINSPDKPSCQYCGSKINTVKTFTAMILPEPLLEEKIDKLGRNNWWKLLEKIDMSEELEKELEELTYYDQLLNTVGRGVICSKCSTKENELLNKYYGN